MLVRNKFLLHRHTLIISDWNKANNYEHVYTFLSDKKQNNLKVVQRKFDSFEFVTIMNRILNLMAWKQETLMLPDIYH